MLPDSPEYKLNKLITDNNSGLSTEGIIHLGSQLCDGEAIFCTTPITPIVGLMVKLDNEVDKKDIIINVSLKVLNRDQMRRSLPFQLYPAHTLIQMARFNGRSPVDPARFNMGDIVNTFGLDDSTIWHLWGYNIETGDSVRCFRLRE
jgi:hypothetical protein